MTINIRNNRLTVYADLNCPFCYALHENLREMNYLSGVSWKCIEHAPQINFSTRDIDTKTELNTEVNKVKTLAPDVNINIPPGRPNTHRANEILAAIQAQAPKQADAFRASLYQALWVDGKDIANPTVLASLLDSAGIDLPEIDNDTLNRLQQWQQEWEEGDFSRNIPALLTFDGNKMLGFPSTQLLMLLIYGDNVNITAENDAICTLHPRENILVASDDTALTKSIAANLDDYSVQQCADTDTAIESALSTNPPDLIFLDSQASGYEACKTISEHTQDSILPIVLLTDTRDDAAEVKAFEMGAADFIHKTTSPSVLKARTRTLLRLKRANDLLNEVAHMDPLTEIPNRREYNRMVELVWRQSIRTQKPLSIILIDIDFFKNYNDNYGHIEGDKCLRSFAHFLQRNIRRPTDLVARYGGEEFVIVLPETSEQGALKLSQLIQQKLAELDIPHAFSSVASQVTVSQGIAGCIPTLNDKPNTLIKAADCALYEAKARGRNKIITAEEIA